MTDSAGPPAPTPDLAADLADRVLVGDGAMGTMLHAAGNSLDRALPELNLSNPDLVRTIHESYLSAGADILSTNTFGAGRLRLAPHGFGDRVADINQAGARIARDVRSHAGRPVFVAGSVAPAVSAAQRGRVGAGDRVAAVREQVAALAEAGVDLLIFETFGYLGELVEAVEAAAGLTGLPIVAQATFTDDGRTLGGETPEEVARALNDLPVAAMGSNCTLGPQGLLSVVTELARHARVPISAQPNAGLPRRVGARRFEYVIDNDYIARYARSFVDAGASLVGGCCGTTPTHIRAAAAAVTGLRPPRLRRTAEPVPDEVPDTPPAAVKEDGLADRLAAREFVVAAGVTPPLGGAVDEAVEAVTALRGHGVRFVAISPRGGARAQMSPISLALHLQQHGGVESIPTVTTWDKTIMTLQADLLGAHALGVRSVVCETGNPPPRGDYPSADGIWEVDSVGLIELLAGLNDGRDCNGLELAAKTSFHIGARCNPNAADPEAEFERARAKIRAGAQFLITRPAYEPEALRALVEALAGERVPILVSVVPLRSFDDAEYLAYEVPDVRIAPETLRAMRQAGRHARRTGLELAGALLDAARTLTDGVVVGVRDDAEPADLDYLLTHGRTPSA